MALTVEDGTGVAGADAYCEVAAVDTYHTNRGNTAWTGSNTVKEQAIRKATDYIEARFARRFVGTRYSKAQGLSWPRTEAYDRDGFLRDDEIPEELVEATAEYALRALSAALLPDPTSNEGAVIRVKEKVGPLEEETEYASGSTSQLPAYPAADRKLTPILKAGGSVAIR